IASNTAKKITVDIVDNDTQKFSRVRKVAPMGVNKCIEDIVDGSGKTVVRRNSAGCVANGIGFLGQDALDRTPISYTAYKNDGTEVPTSDLLKYTVVETVVDTVVVKKTVPVDISVWANKRNAVACIKDNNTGLTWEAKNYLTAQNTRTPSLHAYNLRFLGLGQDSKSVASCEGSGTITATACLAEFFVAEVNHEKLCGMTGWRLPRIEELRSLALYDPVPAENSKLYYHDQNYFWWLSAGVALAVDIFDYTSADSVSGISLGMPFYPSVGGNGINQKILDSNAYSLMLVHD
ncbi:MAG: DUF1566 domain-containing protein, partial [Gammaproteobacteria bacterium]|nr:DUF1566 domain-containing protein [Gammaproteobacteria bacterium]